MLIATTRRLHIRHSTPSDAAFVLELVNTPGWLQYIGNRHIYTEEDALGYITERIMNSYAQHVHGLNTVTLPDGTPIGLCGILKRDSLPLPDIGFAFLPQHAGQGYAYEAAQAVLAHAQQQLGYVQVAAITDQDNTVSINLLRKLGFVLEKRVQLPGEEMELNYFVKDL
jgi:[ribosomal protein S5]-alanine N-acetyltransferase